MKNKNIIAMGVTIGLLLLTACIALFTVNKGLKQKLKESEDKSTEIINLLAGTQDTLQVFKNIYGLNQAQISRLESQSAETFLKLDLKDTELKELQQIIKDNKKNIKKPGDGAILIGGTTKIDTVYASKSEEREWEKKSIARDFKDPWVELRYFIAQDSTGFKLDVTNKYSLILGTDKEGKKYADITNYNPYSTTTQLRTYQLSEPKVKKKTWGLGVSAGYYFHGDQFRPGIGFSLTKNLIMLW